MTKLKFSSLASFTTNHFRGAFAPDVIGELLAAEPLGAVAVYFPRLAEFAAAAAVAGALALVVRHGRPA